MRESGSAGKKDRGRGGQRSTAVKTPQDIIVAVIGNDLRLMIARPFGGTVDTTIPSEPTWARVNRRAKEQVKSGQSLGTGARRIFHGA